MTDNLKDHKKLLVLTALASVAVACILIVAKAIAWHMSSSVGIMASLLDSIADSMASLVNLLAILYALQPADQEHRFGHGKAESVAALAQSVFIFISACFLLWHASNRIFEPQDIAHADIGILVMILSMPLTAALLVIQRRTIRITGSQAIAADWLHYASDLAVNFGVIIGLLLAFVGFSQADGFIGGIVGLMILWSAGKLAGTAFQDLLDREMSEKVRADIANVVAQQEQVLGFHDLRTRQSGSTQFIQLHLDIDANLPLRDAHALADQVEMGIKKRYPNADVIIHQDPVEVSPHCATHLMEECLPTCAVEGELPKDPS